MIINDNVENITTTEANANGGNEHAFLTDPPIIDEDEEEIRRRVHTGPDLYRPGDLPRPRFVMLGQQGVGKVRGRPAYKYIWIMAKNYKRNYISTL